MPLFLTLLMGSATLWSASAKAAPGQITGTVFRDYDGNAAIGMDVPGIANMSVRAYDASGDVATTANGTYILRAPAGMPSALSGNVHLEFSRPADGSPWFLYPGDAGGTTVPFANITSGASGVNAGFNNPAEYRQLNPWGVMPIYRIGRSNGSASNAIRAHVYSASSKTPTLVALASQGQVGSTWGLANQSEKKRLFAASVLRRHAGLSLGPGDVHVANWTGSAGSSAGSFNLQGVVPANGGAAIDLGSVCRREATALMAKLAGS